MKLSLVQFHGFKPVPKRVGRVFHGCFSMTTQIPEEIRIEKPRWGLDNPHPLSQMKTELIWEGKYDEYGNRREVDIAGCAMPMQKIETVDEPSDRLKQLGLFDSRQAYPDDFRNRLIWGDNKLVMASLLQEFKGQVKLIYIDPPFDAGADFTLDIPIGDESETLHKEQSVLEMIAYRDIWGKETDSYLYMMYERLTLMRELLSEDGSIYVHCDRRVGYYLGIMLQDVFGPNFVNEITWHYYNKMAPDSKCFPRASDKIICFAKTLGKHIFNKQLEKRDKPVKQLVRKFVDGKAINARDEDGNVQYRETDEKRVDDVWRMSMLQPADKSEYTGYATQKPRRLLERIISASTNEGDLVADFFCGSGTTLDAAERLGRRWIGSDLGRFAIHTSRKRMIEVQRERHGKQEPYRPFDVYNLGRYERQWWQKERLQGADDEHRKVVLGFYKAEVLTQSPSPFLHGRKGRAFCHVDSIDSLLTREELESVAEACHNAGGKELHCLAWEFEMNLKEIALRLEKDYDLDSIRLIPIPREIMEKNRKELPPFLEVAELEAKPIIRKEGKRVMVDVELTKFLPSLAEVPSKELEALRERAIQNGFDFIDFWAIDFDYHPSQPFYHHWQTYRTRKNRKLPTTSNKEYEYATPGKHTICIKVIDVFGCDTTTLLEVNV